MNEIAQAQALRLQLYVSCSQCAHLIDLVDRKEMSKRKTLFDTQSRNTSIVWQCPFRRLYTSEGREAGKAIYETHGAGLNILGPADPETQSASPTSIEGNREGTFRDCRRSLRNSGSIVDNRATARAEV
jgi:hypothetical protein